SMLIISVLVGIMTYLGFLFLGLDFALFLGLLNGTTNLIPFIGPFIGAVPAVGVALLDSPALALRVLILIIVIQQLESQVISPQLLGRSLGFHPLFVIFALLLGGHLAGFRCLLFALPLATALRIFFKHFWRVIELSIHK
ncbi:MAG: AI-2E family transporter, partial [Firmicutes bacterium]|nr:AI-2E family transporter [Bacillota bacterium]